MKPTLIPIALLLFAMPLFSTARSNAQEGAATVVDGIYLQGNGLNYRIFEFKNGWVKIKTNQGFELLGRVRTERRTVSARGVVSISYHDGQQNVELSTTYAIHEQKLWLGTFNQTSFRSHPCYLAEMQNAGMFGMNNARCLSGKFYWYSDQGVGLYDPTGGVPPFRFKINKTETHDTDSFQIEIETTSDFSASEAAIFGVNKPFTKSLPAFLKHDRGWEPMHREGRNFQPLDEESRAISTPWSVCLGRVGLFPVEVDEADLIGDWSDNSVVAKQPFGRLPSPLIAQDLNEQAPLFLPGATEGTFKQLQTLVYSPDPENFDFSHSSAAYNCMQGHRDVPGHVFWFPISDTEIAKFSSPPTHGGGAEFQQTIISKKAKKENE